MEKRLFVANFLSAFLFCSEFDIILTFCGWILAGARLGTESYTAQSVCVIFCRGITVTTPYETSLFSVFIGHKLVLLRFVIQNLNDIILTKFKRGWGRKRTILGTEMIIEFFRYTNQHPSSIRWNPEGFENDERSTYCWISDECNCWPKQPPHKSQYCTSEQ